MRLNMTAPPPAERKVTVTLSLDFKESQLQAWARDHMLGQSLNDAFVEAARGVGNSFAQDVYDLLKNL